MTMVIGKIVSVGYDKFRVLVHPTIKGGSVNLEGTVYYFGNIGGYLKTTNAVGEKVVCEISAIFDSDQYNDKKAFDVDGKRELILKPIGTISRDGGFSLGVGVFPSIYTDVEIVTHIDMGSILGLCKEKEESEEGVHEYFYLGESKNLINYPIDISINNFFNIHSAVLGNSGSGKSNTVSHILQDILKKESNAAVGSRVIVFDVNGEYGNAFPEWAVNKDISVKCFKPVSGEESEPGCVPFGMPHFLMTLDEWCSFLLATDATQRPFWDKVLQECYRFYKMGDANGNYAPLMANYLKAKIFEIVNSITSQAESDTVNITAASSVLSKVREVIRENSAIYSVCQLYGVEQVLTDLINSCGIDYGSNKGRVKGYLESLVSQINQEDYLYVINTRFREGEFFDSGFLKIAAELVLLEEDARGNRRVREYTATMLTRLDYFLQNPDCRFMREPLEGDKSIEGYMNYFWSGNEGQSKSQVVIIDVSELGPDTLEVLTSVVTRLMFSERKKLKNEERRSKPIHLVLDEAHRYIKKNAGYYLRENIFEKVAREGRKYSFYLLVSSQRPSELSETVLSQCGNFVVHRIQNEIDMRFVYSVLPFFSEDLTSKVKQAMPGDALIFGNCVPLPLYLKVHRAYPEPDSENCHIPTEWFGKNYHQYLDEDVDGLI